MCLSSTERYGYLYIDLMQLALVPSALGLVHECVPMRLASDGCCA